MLSRLLLLGHGGATGGTTLMGQSARVFRTTTQSIPRTTWTSITWDTTLWDTDGIVNLGTHPTWLTCQTSGVYIAFMQISLAAADAGTAGGGAILLNGTTYYTSGNFPFIASGFGQPVGTLVNLTVGDHLEFQVWHNSSGSVSTVADPYDGCGAMIARLP